MDFRPNVQFWAKFGFFDQLWNFYEISFSTNIYGMLCVSDHLSVKPMFSLSIIWNANIAHPKVWGPNFEKMTGLVLLWYCIYNCNVVIAAKRDTGPYTMSLPEINYVAMLTPVNLKYSTPNVVDVFVRIFAMTLDWKTKNFNKHKKNDFLKFKIGILCVK